MHRLGCTGFFLSGILLEFRMFFCIIEEESTQDNTQDNSYTGNVFMENSHNEPKYIEVRGACVHNLKNINVNVPLHQIAGIDGDGCKYRFAGNRGFKGCASAAGSAQKSARTFFGECDQSRGDEQKFMEVKKYHSAAILLGQYVAVQIFLHYSTGNLSEAGAMADCSRQNRIPKIMDWGFGILKCVRKNIMEKRKLPFGRMSLNWRLCFRNE